METTTIVIDNAVSSGAIEVLNSNILQCYDVLYSIRIILICFLVWLVICAVHRFLNMFF